MEPKIRLKGFTGEWITRTLGSLGSVAMCKRIFKDQTSSKGDVPFYKIGTFGAAPDAFISRELFLEYKSRFNYPQKGDILISAAGTIGRAIEYQGDEAYFQDSNIVWLDHNDEIENSFLKQLYSVITWKGLEGATIKRLYNNIILETEINLPSKDEQQAIASYFQHLDSLIQSITKKIESLKQVKAASLQSMFPQEGETTPRVRFKGFDGEWEKAIMGDISTSFSGGTPLAGVEEFYGGNIPFIRSGEIGEDKTQLFITEQGLSSSSARIVEKGTLLYALYGATSGEVSISKIKGAINQAILAIYPKNGYSSSYLAHYLRAKKDYIVGTLLQGGQGNLSGALVKSVNLRLPKTLEEQQKIADYFTNFDSQITLQAQRLEKLKQIKSACLDNMFV